MAALAAACCLSFAASAQSQSLAEVAKREKARRAENSQTDKDKEVVVVDEFALRNTHASTFSAVEVTGGATRESAPATPVELGRPAPENPNRAKPPAPAKNKTQASAAPPRLEQTELGKGWTTDRGNTSQMREAPPGTKPIHPTTPRTQVGHDKNGNPIYR